MCERQDTESVDGADLCTLQGDDFETGSRHNQLNLRDAVHILNGNLLLNFWGFAIAAIERVDDPGSSQSK